MTDATVDAGRFKGWVRPGPVPPGGVELEEGESLDFHCGHWRIFQLIKGHRFSVDDVLCGAYAASCAPRVERYLDIGSGIGSVALTVAWRLPGCTGATVEAQEISKRLADKTFRYNGIDHRFHRRVGDLRDAALMDLLAQDHGPFDLVTGSPPYWPVGSAMPSAQAQAIPARLEVRGSIVDYAATAARMLAPGGFFVCVFQASHDARVRAALRDAGLALVRTRAVAFKAGQTPEQSGIRLYAAARASDVPRSFGMGTKGKPIEEPVLLLRNADGSVGAEYAALRLSYGFPTGDADADE
jgi:tRNA1Val (adenine37-N6)-methyltransferase